jgi:hypothetical protein
VFILTVSSENQYTDIVWLDFYLIIITFGEFRRLMCRFFWTVNVNDNKEASYNW